MLLSDERALFSAAVENCMKTDMRSCHPRDIEWAKYGCAVTVCQDALVVYPANSAFRRHAATVFTKNRDAYVNSDWDRARALREWTCFFYEDGSDVLARTRTELELRAKQKDRLLCSR